tara:strand:- start:264 stop:455 length:192 start_codon:yes stop_codon:yes gene_type:complete
MVVQKSIWILFCFLFIVCLSSQINAHGNYIIDFDADKKGVWEFICSIYCGFGHSTMKGVFVVR